MQKIHSSIELVIRKGKKKLETESINMVLINIETIKRGKKKTTRKGIN